ncbi:uncharacterized protein A4U43_UnF7240 [Asparagus officinalis]|uniref:C3H1-type domain-containing protein n=2 Tax=Asparagus officinalis TaxID=4686 RepID=A0A1R3L694_ASPOF|nr:uncharacterized protein A4U43_UnF7240 [Asparagus officinalis]
MAQTPAYNMNKQSRSEPCIFFQKGYCLKGERCPFSHEVHAKGNVVPPQAAKASPLLPEQPQAFKKEPWGIKQCANQQNVPKVSVELAPRAPVSSAKPSVGAEISSLNGLTHAKDLLPPSSSYNLPRFQPVHPPVVNSNNAWTRSLNHQSDVEPGEIVGEHSSGFDVHVAKKYNMKGSAHFRDGDDFGRKSAQGGRKVETLNDFKSANIYERNQFSSSVDKFEQNGRAKDYYDIKQHRSSSERSFERSLLPERRVLQRQKSPEEVDRADLRHRLKQRKLDDRYVEEKYRGHTIESSVSARLRGRISLPGTSSGDSFRLQPEKDRDLSRNRGRLSPTRPPLGNQGRRYDRTRRSSEDPPTFAGSRSLGSRLTKRVDADSVNFSGPKSLAELKGVKSTRGYQYSERSLSFEGPKPLSALLKRKRGGDPVDGVNSSDGDENNQRNEVAGVSYSDPSSVAEQVQPSSVLDSNKEDERTITEFGPSKAETVEEEEEDSTPSRDDDLTYDGAIDAMEEDQGLQNLDQRGDEYDYEANETGDLKTEYASQGEEEDELDDEEDFARKAGLLFS